MEFKAKRLRIQIPCGGSGSLIDIAGGCGDSPGSAFCPTPPPKPPPNPPCGVPSPIFDIGNPLDPIVNPVLERFVLEPEQLPLLKRELELRLKLLETAEFAVETRRQQIRSHLADVDRVEEQLRQDVGERDGEYD